MCQHIIFVEAKHFLVLQVKHKRVQCVGTRPAIHAIDYNDIFCKTQLLLLPIMDDPPYYGCGPWSDTLVAEFTPYPDSENEDEVIVMTPPLLIRSNRREFRQHYINHRVHDGTEVTEEELTNARIRALNIFFQAYNNTRVTQLNESDTEEVPDLMENSIASDTDEELPALAP